MRGFRDVSEKVNVREKCPWPSVADMLPDHLGYIRESDHLPDRLGYASESDNLPDRLGEDLLPDDSGNFPPHPRG